MNHTNRAGGALLFLSVWGSSLVGCSSDQQLQTDVRDLKAEVQTLHNDLAAIQRALAGRGGNPDSVQLPVTVRIVGSPTLGKHDAPVTIAEFSDYQCPYCGKFFQETFSTLKTEYIDTGKVRYVFRDFPLEQIHADARKAHEAAYCAGDHGKYWEMHDLLFHHQTGMHVDELQELAGQLHLTPETFATCVTTGQHADEIDRNLQEGRSLHVSGTPTFFIGKSTPDEALDAVSLVGAQPIGAFRTAIDNLLKGREP